ncbi:MAG: ribonuclease P protein subunit [Candidatus Woesearchaeota archaeon]
MDTNTAKRKQLIGMNVVFVHSANKRLIGSCGKIIDETKNSFLVEVNGRVLRLLKNSVVMRVEVNGKKYNIEGNKLAKRPEDRINMRI